jgi:GDP-L-fucose synthase
MFKGKKVLVTGSEGMIGKELVKLLEKRCEVIKTDIKLGKHDLRQFTHCLHLCRKADYVFHLAGVKGNPRMTNERPVDFMGPMLQFDTNMILAAQECGVKKFLYTSSIAAEHPEADFYPAWAKQTAENLISAMRIQYKGTKYCIARPANVYGRFDNFKRDDLMVISSLIKKGLSSFDQLEVWGDGSPIRDFINAKDVARAMILIMEKMPKDPIPICSGQGISIKMIAEIIAKYTDTKTVYKGKDLGAKIKIMDNSKLKKLGFKPEVSIEDGIKEVISYRKNGI